MQAGMLRERVTVRNPIVTVDENGQATYAYQDILSLDSVRWASVRATSQNKGETGESQPHGAETFEVRMRYVSSVPVGYATRLTWGDRTLEVVAVENVRNVDHEIRCTCEVVDL